MKNLKCQQFNNHTDKTTLDKISGDKHNFTLPALLNSTWTSLAGII